MQLFGYTIIKQSVLENMKLALQDHRIARDIAVNNLMVYKELGDIERKKKHAEQSKKSYQKHREERLQKAKEAYKKKKLLLTY